MLEEHVNHPNLHRFMWSNEIEDVDELKTENELNDLGYFNQTYIGNIFPCQISRISVGNLFRLVGLAKENSTNTIPHIELIPEFAMFGCGFSGASVYSLYCWQPEKCKSYIDNWLQKRTLFDSFYSFNDSNLLKKFIKNLSKTNVEQKEETHEQKNRKSSRANKGRRRNTRG